MTMLGSLEVLMDWRGSSIMLVMEGRVRPRDRLLLLFPCMPRVTDPCERLSEKEESLLREWEACIVLFLCRCPCGAWMGFLWPVSWIGGPSGDFLVRYFHDAF